MRPVETISTAPIPVQKSVRGEEIRALTSCKAGTIVPLAYIPLLREDRVASGKVRVRLDMAETVHPLMNAVNVTVYAHFVPFSAFERFLGMDSFNRSYQGIPEPYNSTVIPFFNTMTFDRTAQFWKKLGIQWKDGTPINKAPVEAYNLLVNWRRAQRSDKLPVRALNNATLAQSFWHNPNLWHIVPDFESAVMDGEVPLNLSGRLPVSGIGVFNASNTTAAAAAQAMRDAAGGTSSQVVQNANSGVIGIRTTGTLGTLRGDVFAEMAGQQVKVSLSNIELAKKTAAFAKMREQFTGLSDDHLIDLLMEGIRVPDESLRQPILLDKKSTIFGYTQRFASDGVNLAKSVTTGLTMVDLSIRTPPMNTGGIILITVEIVPEALFERMKDRFLATTGPEQLPNFLRDFLDPEKVEVVRNDFVDTEHATPAGTFGYAPLNHDWKRSLTRVGGRYYRPIPDTFVEDRQRFWSIEQLNPTLATDFYLTPSAMPHTVFADSTADPFEILTTGSLTIVGNTVFGKVLTENDGQYANVSTEVDATRIIQP